MENIREQQLTISLINFSWERGSFSILKSTKFCNLFMFHNLLKVTEISLAMDSKYVAQLISAMKIKETLKRMNYRMQVFWNKKVVTYLGN